MKIKRISQLAAVSFLAYGMTAFAETQLTLNQLPQAVQNVVQTETKNGPVNQIQQMNLNGQTVYQVGFQQAGNEKYIYLNPDGSYYQQSGTPASTTTSSSSGSVRSNGRVFNLTLNQLPQKVQSVIQTETVNGPVDSIQEIPLNGKRVYKVAFRQSDGTQKLIYLNRDGSYVQNEGQTAVGAPATSTTGSRTSLSSATKVNFGQLPAAVQNAIRALANGAAVEDIDQGTLNGQTVYQAAFKQNGQTVELRVDQKGNVIQDSEDAAIQAAAPH